MPHQTAPLTPRQKRREKAERARKILAGATLRRDDSDDELGEDDHPWEWIYENGKGGDDDDDDGEDGGEDEEKEAVTPSRKRRRNGSRMKIVGAMMGDFKCKIGDTMLLRAEGSNASWVGIIWHFGEDEEGEKSANFLWFSNEKEIHNKQKKRSDFLPVSRPGFLEKLRMLIKPRTRSTSHQIPT